MSVAKLRKFFSLSDYWKRKQNFERQRILNGALAGTDKNSENVKSNFILSQ